MNEKEKERKEKRNKQTKQNREIEVSESSVLNKREKWDIAMPTVFLLTLAGTGS